MLSRDLNNARQAYKLGDVEASIEAHLLSHKLAEKHKSGGNFLKSFVYGGMDGIITTFSIVTGVFGSSLGAKVVVILGVSNVIGDGLAMAFGDYLSSKAEIEFQQAEKARETWEVENNPEGEMMEMEELYIAKGIAEEDAKVLTQILSKNKQVWIDIMMVEELGIIEETEAPWKKGMVTFFSFVICGLFPLLPFLVCIRMNVDMHNIFYVAVGVTAFSLFFIGAIKTRFTDVNFFKSGLETLIIGAVAASSSYAIGYALEPIAH